MKYWLILLFVYVTHTKPDIQYPIRFAYVNKIDSWWPIKDVAKGMGIPGYAPKNIYNMFSLTVWTYQRGPLDLVKLWDDPVTYLSEQSDFGRTNTEIRKNIKQKYSNSSIKLLISAFAESQYPATDGVDPILCATKLALFVKDKELDGVDINYEDSKAFEDGVGEFWLIKFTKKIRELLPNHIISHAPQASDFHTNKYKNGGYMRVHQQVGHLIDFYNVQFYNQMQEQYNTYQTLFIKSITDSFVFGTSVNQLKKRGVPLKKIVIGKPASEANVKNTGLVSGQQLGEFIMKGYEQIGWYTGVMVWEYYSDIQGTFIKNAAGDLVESYLFDQLSSILSIETSSPDPKISQPLFPSINLPDEEFSELQFLTTTTVEAIQQKPKEPFQPRKINYPIRFAPIDKIASWWPPESIAASLGVPGFANDTIYNYFSLSAWTYRAGPLNLAKVWDNPIKYFSNASEFGETNQTIRKRLKAGYHSKNIGVLVSAFGSSENPISDNIQPIECAEKLGQYVLRNQLDGVQIKILDTEGLKNGIGEFWLIKFISQLRKILPDHLIVNTCMAAHFNESNYRMGGYPMINKAVGQSIDFYNIIYFDQGDTLPFESYQQIFMLSGPPRQYGVSVRQLAFRGVPMHKVVVGKPVLESNSLNTGWMDLDILGNAMNRAYKEMRWFGGIMLWQYYFDMNGKMIKEVAEQLIITCAASQFCQPPDH